MFDTYSRYRHSTVLLDEITSSLMLTRRPAFAYEPDIGEVAHVVTEGDTFITLASMYYSSMPDPHTLWWAIAEFQPEPHTDPTVKLTPGDVILVPPMDAVQEWLLRDVDDMSELM